MRFSRQHVLAGSPEDAIAVVALLALVASVIAVRRRRTGTYDPGVAWLRAGGYLAATTLAAWSTGVLSALVRGASSTPDASGWPLWTAAAVLVELVAYAVIWPLGTFHQDRASRPTLQVAFGLGWGLAQGMVFLSAWALAELLGLTPGWASVAAGLVISGYQGTLHRLWWDVHVSPEHNDPAWDARKVGLAHTPNLVVALAHFTRFGSPWTFVALQTIALVSASLVMRFPAPRSPSSPATPSHPSPEVAT